MQLYGCNLQIAGRKQTQIIMYTLQTCSFEPAHPAMAPVATPSRPISPSGACTSAADIWWKPELRPVTLPGGAGGAPGVCSGTCDGSQHVSVLGKSQGMG